MKIVGCLQNVWFYPYVSEERCRDPLFWYRAFVRCRSGQRLTNTLGQSLFDSFQWENASPQIGRESGAKFPADPAHIRTWLTVRKPDIIVAFGQVAEHALRLLWTGDLVCVPHPASRLVTNELYLRLRDVILDETPRNGTLRVALRQGRGVVTFDQLGEPPTAQQRRGVRGRVLVAPKPVRSS